MDSLGMETEDEMRWSGGDNHRVGLRSSAFHVRQRLPTPPSLVRTGTPSPDGMGQLPKTAVIVFPEYGLRARKWIYLKQSSSVVSRKTPVPMATQEYRVEFTTISPMSSAHGPLKASFQRDDSPHIHTKLAQNSPLAFPSPGPKAPPPQTPTRPQKPTLQPLTRPDAP